MTEKLVGNEDQPLLGGFGPRAPAYAVSQVHVSDESLEIMRGLAGRASAGQSQWAVDLGTGARLNALNPAPVPRSTAHWGSLEQAPPANPLIIPRLSSLTWTWLTP